LTRLDICTMSDGAAACLVVSDEGLEQLRRAGVRPEVLHPRVRIIGIGSGLDTMRLTDRPHFDYGVFERDYALPHELENPDIVRYYRELAAKGFRYPGIHSFRSGRMASKLAYEMAGITNPLQGIDVVELHDAYTSSEIQTCEDMGLCAYGEGGTFVDMELPFLTAVDYDLPHVPQRLLVGERRIPVNPSGGLIACGHPVGATGLMQAVFVLWQLTDAIGRHFGNGALQVPNARRGAWHSHAGTGSYVTVTIGGREN